jgi:hypothetical protein
MWITGTGRFAGGRTVPAPSGTTLARFFRPRRSRPIGPGYERRGVQPGKASKPGCTLEPAIVRDHAAPRARLEELLPRGNDFVGRQEQEHLSERVERLAVNATGVDHRDEGDSREQPPQHAEVDGANPRALPRTPDRVQGSAVPRARENAAATVGATSRVQHSRQITHSSPSRSRTIASVFKLPTWA